MHRCTRSDANLIRSRSCCIEVPAFATRRLLTLPYKHLKPSFLCLHSSGRSLSKLLQARASGMDNQQIDDARKAASSSPEPLGIDADAGDNPNKRAKLKDGRSISPTSGASSLHKLLAYNRQWSERKRAEDPDFFNRISNIQTPEFLWIGCSDSRVPANQILGLAPGEVFVQRNVGNQAMHTDMNLMSCLEYAVGQLKVKTVIVCGHYGCGAVKAALTLSTSNASLVNCWISDIRHCRNEHSTELKDLPTDAQVDRLCELNVLRQTFHVCTSPVVQMAWSSGQDLTVYGLIYSVRDGIIKPLCGPLTMDTQLATASLPLDPLVKAAVDSTVVEALEPETACNKVINTMQVLEKLQQHVSWAGPSDGALRTSVNGSIVSGMTTPPRVSMTGVAMPPRVSTAGKGLVFMPDDPTHDAAGCQHCNGHPVDP